uniref:(northern house mosquito) hypothetical protein n=1 Tax=Culex pipiens TaxID=7175 RepID=A0A8D8KWZ4_CULPI
MTLGATKPPNLGRPLWKRPAPDRGTGLAGTTGWASKKGTVVWAASMPRSLSRNRMNWLLMESGMDLEGVSRGTCGRSSLSSVLLSSLCSVLSLPIQMLLSGSIKWPMAKSISVIRISRLRWLPSSRKRTPVRTYPCRTSRSSRSRMRLSRFSVW